MTANACPLLLNTQLHSFIIKAYLNLAKKIIYSTALLTYTINSGESCDCLKKEFEDLIRNSLTKGVPLLKTPENQGSSVKCFLVIFFPVVKIVFCYKISLYFDLFLK